MSREVDKLTIRVSGKDTEILAESFIRIVRETISILRDLDSKNTVSWMLKEASIRSPLRMTFIATPKQGIERWSGGWSDTYVDIFESLEAGGDLPANVQPKTANRARRLVSVLDDGISQVSFISRSNKEVAPTQRVSARVQELEEYAKSSYVDYHEIEGKLEDLSVHGGNRFAIYDTVTGDRIECNINESDIPRAYELLRQRVSVVGRVKYRKGRPVEIDIDKFSKMPNRDELPQGEDIRGINLTDGMESSEYIREMRDAE